MRRYRQTRISSQSFSFAVVQRTIQHQESVFVTDWLIGS